jgi:hypothetical protein
MTAHLSRRQLLVRGAGLAAGVGLATVAGPARPAVAGSPTTGPVIWTLNGNGYVGDLRFHKQLHHGDTFDVDSGLMADFYGDVTLAYSSGYAGVNVARLAARDLSYFQIWRSTGNGPKGQFFDYAWNGSRYVVGGPYPWHTLQRKDDPYNLPIDNAERDSFPITASAGGVDFPGWMRELHHYNAPNGERQFWGTAYAESVVGYALSTLPQVSAEYPPGEAVLTYQGPYNFLRALDSEFRAFQVYRGTISRYDVYRPAPSGGWQFFTSITRRSGWTTHLDTVSGEQSPLTWHTD